MNKKSKKLIIIMACLQMVVGIATVVVAILFLMGKLGDNVGVCVIPAILCAILACINMCINFKRLKNK